MMSNKTYDRLKLIALLVMPVGTFLSTFFEAWGIPYGAQIEATFKALDILCGSLVVIAKAQYDRKQVQ